MAEFFLTGRTRSDPIWPFFFAVLRLSQFPVIF